MRKRSMIDWSKAPRVLSDDLDRFRAGARGRRLKQLALLGLAAEANGLRLNADGSGLVGLAPAVVALAGTPAETPPVTPTLRAGPTRSAGMDRLMTNFGG